MIRTGRPAPPGIQARAELAAAEREQLAIWWRMLDPPATLLEFPYKPSGRVEFIPDLRTPITPGDAVRMLAATRYLPDPPNRSNP